MKNKRLTGFILAVVIIGAGFICPAPGEFTTAGIRCLFLISAVLVLWVTDALPLAISALVLIAMIPLYGIMPANETFAAFISSVFFFVLATYAISVAIMKTPLARRLSRFFLKWAGEDVNKIILGFMIGSAGLSAIMSNVPVAALFTGIGTGILDELGMKPGESRLGKAMMIGIPFGAMAGGMATPAGSSVNILALSLMEETGVETIRFVDWMIVGIPLVVIFVPIAWFLLIRFFRPEKVEVDFMDRLVASLDVPEKLTGEEKKVIAVVAGMVVLWILSSWIPAINITIVAVVGLIVFNMPGIRMFTWKEFADQVSWDALIVIGCVTAMGYAVIHSGLAEMMVIYVLSPVAAHGLIAFIAILALVVNWIHIPLPIAPSIVAIFIAPVVESSAAFGMNPALSVFTLAAMAGGCFIAPLDAVPLITYVKGYYSFGEYFKAGLITSTILCILMTAVVITLGQIVL